LGEVSFIVQFKINDPQSFSGIYQNVHHPRKQHCHTHQTPVSTPLYAQPLELLQKKISHPIPCIIDGEIPTCHGIKAAVPLPLSTIFDEIIKMQAI
jgi:hypothetical protein